MKTRIVKITRTLTLYETSTIEVPETVTNQEIEDALHDRAALYDRLTWDTSRNDMDESDEQLEAESADAPDDKFQDHRSLDAIREDLQKDGLIPQD